MFLRLTQPKESLDLPQDGTLRAGQKYTFPFEFVVPERLLPSACQHIVSDDAVREAHSQLPPSLGDSALLSQLELPDDLSPINASVRYGIYVRLSTPTAQNSETAMSVLALRAERVRIVPTTSEQPFVVRSDC